MSRSSFVKTILVGVATFCIALPALADSDATSDIGTFDKASAGKLFPVKPSYSPYAGRNFPTRPFFGDTHLHTSFSFDAGAFGCRLGPPDAFKFARGEELGWKRGRPGKVGG